MFTLRAALAAATFAFVLPAFADESPPPSSGTTSSFKAVVCDTSAEIIAIADAAKKDPAAGGKAQYQEFNAAKNAKAEPVCAYQVVMNVTVGEALDLGKFHLGSESWVHGWAVHVGTSDIDGWILYVTETAAPASLDSPMLLPNGLRLI